MLSGLLRLENLFRPQLIGTGLQYLQPLRGCSVGGFVATSAMNMELGGGGYTRSSTLQWATYRTQVLYGVSGRNISKLQRVQNALARVVSGIRKFDHISLSSATTYCTGYLWRKESTSKLLIWHSRQSCRAVARNLGLGVLKFAGGAWIMKRTLLSICASPYIRNHRIDNELLLFYYGNIIYCSAI